MWADLLEHFAHGCAIIFPYLVLLAATLICVRNPWIRTQLESAIQGHDGRVRVKAVVFLLIAFFGIAWLSLDLQRKKGIDNAWNNAFATLCAMGGGSYALSKFAERMGPKTKVEDGK